VIVVCCLGLGICDELITGTEGVIPGVCVCMCMCMCMCECLIMGKVKISALRRPSPILTIAVQKDAKTGHGPHFPN
jgi:hypothetical protein